MPGEYVAKHGCTAARLQASLSFLRESTMRFTSESAIRPFLADFPRETLAFIHDCAAHDHYHVRRLASEGIRPYLPWARRVALPFEDIVEVLDMLHAERTRYVTRSVSNALNDLSKDDTDLVIRTLQRWQKKRRQNSKELEWMTNHALRTLTKAGHNEALELLGFSSNPGFSLSGTVTDKRVKVGSSLTLGTTLKSQAKQKLRISLQLHFLRADGTYTKKVFAIKDVSMNKGEHLDIKKSVSFKPISTRTLYPGRHYAEVLVNGTTRGKRSFELIR